MNIVGNLAGEVLLSAVGQIMDKKPYGIVQKRHPITYNGQNGYLVWDYIIWNELTFENADTHEKMSLFNSISDQETEKKFNEFVCLYTRNPVRGFRECT